jgi:hypothetical protein
VIGAAANDLRPIAMATETSGEDLQPLLALAQQGDDSAVQRLFVSYRSYLVTLARPQIHRRLQGKVYASDLAEETMLEAHRCFVQFRGTSTPEFAGRAAFWLIDWPTTCVITSMRKPAMQNWNARSSWS